MERGIGGFEEEKVAENKALRSRRGDFDVFGCAGKEREDTRSGEREGKGEKWKVTEGRLCSRLI